MIRETSCCLPSVARRLCMPEVPEEAFLGALKALVREDASWVPSEPGASLYVRPTMIGGGDWMTMTGGGGGADMLMMVTLR